MRISMQILADRLRQNYPDCSFGELSGEMNLKRPLFYQSGTEFRKNKVYIVHETDISETELLELPEYWSRRILQTGTAVR